jgi:hypothetical protein
LRTLRANRRCGDSGLASNRGHTSGFLKAEKPADGTAHGLEGITKGLADLKMRTQTNDKANHEK